ncbi:fructose-bisphosphate aldolase class I [Patescibacteria group bacterium]|nr:fructose-bisphosphate aldolase class I [Patescibacteria group bacterium]MBU1755065.1 fructose-bisphosphate aldolase class I [Patescibacteria group bacterium]
MTDLPQIARELMTHGKGILAADESTKSADARLTSYGIIPSEEKRREFRDLFLSTPNVEEYLTGVIMYEETLDQKASSGKLFPAHLESKGIIPGIKVDMGTEPMPGSPKELITGGLLGLEERLAAFKAKYHTGFTKWRAVVRIDGTKLPTTSSILENAKRLAQYAYVVQEAGMVPIVEPEVLYEGTHSILRSKEVLQQTLTLVIETMKDKNVDLSAVIVKTSMALSGKETGRIDSPEEVAEHTLDALMAAVPSEVPGIVFLSGGQGNDQATDNLAAISKRAKEINTPWPLTFSYSRALQDEALTEWKGESSNVDSARAVFISRLQKVVAALS